MSAMSENSIVYQHLFDALKSAAQIYENALQKIACSCDEDCCADEIDEVPCVCWVAAEALRRAAEDREMM